MEPATDSLTTQTYWEQSWAGQDQRLWTDLDWVRSQYCWAAWDARLRAQLRPDPEKRFLQVGCGTGRWLVYFHKAFGYQVTGCDYSAASCQMARTNLAAAGVPGTVLEQDLFALTGEYDVVYSGGLIEHFQDPTRVLEKFVSLLNPSRGLLISTVPNLCGLSGLYQRLLKPETFTTHRLITLDELRRWYEDIGLQNIEVGALGSVVPLRFPRDKLRREHPRFYRFLWRTMLHPWIWGTNRACLWLLRRRAVRFESPRFSPHLYAIGEKR